MTINGWLFDVYPYESGVVLWFIGTKGEKYRACYPFKPSFFLHLRGNDLTRGQSLGKKSPSPVSFVTVKRRELFSNETVDVLQVFVHEPTKFSWVVRYYEQFFPHYCFYDSDLLVAQEFLFETRLFGLALGEYFVDESGTLTRWILHDSQESVDYELPPLSVMLLRNANDFVPAKY